MIKADHNIFAQKLFYAYIKRLMKKHYSHFYLVNKPPIISDKNSLVFVPNHISWWDGFFIGHIERNYYNRKVHIMMLEEQLKKYWFFKKVGAYSISPGNIKSFLETRNYTRELISNNSNSVIIYPQGEIESYEKRPLSLKKGLDKILDYNQNNVSILPVAFKIQYYSEMKPSIIVRFGREINSFELKNNFNLFEQEFYSNLDQLSKAAETQKISHDLFNRKSK